MNESIKTNWQEHLRGWWDHYQWLLIGGAWLLAVCLGYVGFARYAAWAGDSPTPWDLFYLTLQLIPMNSGAVTGPVSWELNAARLLFPLLTAFTAVQAFAALFQEQSDLVRLRFFHDHVVICGLSQKGLLLSDSFRARGTQVVVIEQAADNPLLARCRARGAIVLVGDATGQHILAKAGVQRAKAVIAVCENDGVNAEIALKTRELVKDRAGSALTCLIHIVDPQLYSLIREREFDMEAGTAFRMELFNVYSRGAQLLLQDLPGFNTSGETSQQHLVVIGLGMMGESLVTNAARLWRESNNHAGRSFQITVVDRDAIRKTRSLSVRYPRLQDYCALIPCEMDVHAAEFQSGDFVPGSQGLAGVTCFCVCLDDDSLSLYTGMVLLQLTRAYDMPIIVRLSEISGLARLMNTGGNKNSAFKRLQAFGLLERTCTPDLLLGGTHEILAMAIHEDYLHRQKQLEHEEPGIDSLPPWELLSERLKESNRRQADQIGIKINLVGCNIAPLKDWDAASFEFTAEEIEAMAQVEHENWVKQLKAEGWVYAAGVSNLLKKTHPDLLPWQELPEKEKEKNRRTVRGIPRFLARAGFQVERQNKIQSIQPEP